ncbi:hypothetical protein QCA50_007544 [Cerrena zonata]|uniref:Uncharacterized protein n=1 Tax=Cerrena zonata TaxID=2478898 RepID=A0AAW0GIP7_9APHY
MSSSFLSQFPEGRQDCQNQPLQIQINKVSVERNDSEFESLPATPTIIAPPLQNGSRRSPSGFFVSLYRAVKGLFKL